MAKGVTDWKAGDRARVVHTSRVWDVAHVSMCPEHGDAVLWDADDGRGFVASFCELMFRPTEVSDGDSAVLL